MVILTLLYRNNNMNYPDWMSKERRLKHQEAYERRKAALEKRAKERGELPDLPSVLDQMKNPSGKHRLPEEDDEDF